MCVILEKQIVLRDFFLNEKHYHRISFLVQERKGAIKGNGYESSEGGILFNSPNSTLEDKQHRSNLRSI